MARNPATKNEVVAAMARERVGLDPTFMAEFDHYLIDPEPAGIDRFGREERAYVVARSATHVVFFDDIEEDFGTARRVEGRLVNTACLGGLALALQELARLDLR